MGNLLGGQKRKGKKNKQKRITPLPPLEFYETSSEDWVFSKEHIDAICDLLQKIQLEMMEEIIFEYLGKIKDAKQQFNFVEWNHPNYTTYIHIKNTPLDDGFKPKGPLKSKMHNSSVHVAEYKVLMMGDGGVGKSSLVTRFITGNFPDVYDPISEDSYRRICALGVSKDDYDKSVDVDGTDPIIFDIYDQCRLDYDPMEHKWMREGHIFILVFSVVSKHSFEEVQYSRGLILRCKNVFNFPMILVGNKCDLRGQYVGNEVNMDAVYEWCKKFKIPYIETSARSNKNVNLLFRQSVYEYRMWHERQ